MKPLKKIFAIAVLFFVLFNSMGYYILFELDKLIAQKEARARVSKGETNLICLKIAGGEHNPSFLRMGKNEFLFNGKMYDLVREIDKDGSLLIFCIPDTKEDDLFTGLKRINHHQRLSLWDLMVKIALPEETAEAEFLTPENFRFPDLAQPYSSSFLSTWSPPPERS
jgi:hypothetical protein